MEMADWEGRLLNSHNQKEIKSTLRETTTGMITMTTKMMRSLRTTLSLYGAYC